MTSTLPPELDDRIFTACQGKQWGYQLFHWWRQLQCPLDGAAIPSQHKKIHDAGMLELAISFFVCTGRHFPVPGQMSQHKMPARNAGSLVFLEFTSTEARMLPKSLRSAAKQVTACQSAIQQLQGLSSDKWMTDHVSTGGTSMKQLGFKQNLKGLTPPPILPCQTQTMDQVRRYFQSLDGATPLSQPLDDY